MNFAKVSLRELQNGITGGAVERNDSGQMVAFLKTHGPSQSLQELNERLGLASFEMISDDEEISTNSNQPTVFTYDNTVTLPQGEEILDMNTWSKFKLPVNISCHIVARAQGVLEGNIFSGSFGTNINYLEIKIVIQMSGTFKIYLT